MRIFSILFVFLPVCLISCTSHDVATGKKEIDKVLDAWHKAAADADFEAYFSHMTPEGVFIGTDATENWQNEAFRTFAQPYFDRGKAWSFTAVERHIYIDESAKTAWFDELLDTQMKLCRGSGVLQKTGGVWKIVHYVLSIAIPNDDIKKVVELKTAFDDALLKKLKEKP